jgi:hypothetical protein
MSPLNKLNICFQFKYIKHNCLCTEHSCNSGFHTRIPHRIEKLVRKPKAVDIQLLGYGFQSSRLYQISRLSVKVNPSIPHLNYFKKFWAKAEKQEDILKLRSEPRNYYKLWRKSNTEGSQTVHLILSLLIKGLRARLCVGLDEND